MHKSAASKSEIAVAMTDADHTRKDPKSDFSFSPEEEAAMEARMEAEARRRARASYIAPKLYKCLQKYQFYWPEFNSRRMLSVLFVDWYKEQQRTGVEHVDWPALFKAINRVSGWSHLEPEGRHGTAWHYIDFEWLPFLESCERKADPVAFAARKERERKAAIQRGIDQMDREFAEREQEIRKAQAKAALAQAQARKAKLQALKRSRTATVKRICSVLGCSRSRGYDIADNGTENPVQQSKLAAGFEGVRGRDKPADWSLKGSTRFERSLKSFLLSGIAEFDAELGPDIALLRVGLESVPLSRMTAHTLAIVLTGLGGNASNAYLIMAQYQQWRDSKRNVGGG